MPKPLSERDKLKCVSICENYNSTRTVFDWDHLKKRDFLFIFIYFYLFLSLQFFTIIYCIFIYMRI
jgi:hypothetical protein